MSHADAFLAGLVAFACGVALLALAYRAVYNRWSFSPLWRWITLFAVTDALRPARRRRPAHPTIDAMIRDLMVPLMAAYTQPRCTELVAGHVRCAMPAGHEGDHAVSLTDMERAGYVRAPF